MTATPADTEPAPTPEPTPTPEPSPPRRRSSGLRRAIAITLAVAVVFGVAAALYTALRTPQYTASTLVQITATEVTPTEKGDQIDDSDMATQRLVMNSDVVAAQVVKQLQLDKSTKTVQNAVAVQQVNDSTVLRLTVTWDSSKGAATVANAFADQYLKYRDEQRDARLTQIGDTGDNGLRPASGGQVLTPATTTGHPAGPKPAVLIVLAAFLGLIVGAVLAYLRESRGAPGVRAAS